MAVTEAAAAAAVVVGDGRVGEEFNELGEAAKGAGGGRV